MPANVRFDGLFELKEALTQMPADVQAEAQDLVFASADAAADDLREHYPERTTGLKPGPSRKTPWFAPGQLRARVFVSKRAGQFSMTATVKNTDPIAWLYDNGSSARHWSNGKFVGAMPATHLFVRTMIRHRARMYDALKAVVAKHGLTVSGDA